MPLHHLLFLACLGQARLAEPSVQVDSVPLAQLVERQLAAMGTSLSIQVEASERSRALAASEAAARAIEAAEERLSTWHERSELARINALAVGETHVPSNLLGCELGRALGWAARTSGAFDPSLGALIRAWGLRGERRLPSPGELSLALKRCGTNGFEWTFEGKCVTNVRRLRPLVMLEEGAFGKGAGLEAALVALADAAASGSSGLRARLDLGGQLAFFGSGSHTAEIAHPRRRAEPLLRVQCAAGSLATSGNSERGGVAVDGVAVGHLLDSVTGRPAADFGSVSVWAPRALDADALATALFVLGPERGLELAHALRLSHVLYLIDHGVHVEVRATPGWGDLESLADNLVLETASSR